MNKPFPHFLSLKNASDTQQANTLPDLPKITTTKTQTIPKVTQPVFNPKPTEASVPGVVGGLKFGYAASNLPLSSSATSSGSFSPSLSAFGTYSVTPSTGSFSPSTGSFSPSYLPFAFKRSGDRMGDSGQTNLQKSGNIAVSQLNSDKKNNAISQLKTTENTPNSSRSKLSSVVSSIESFQDLHPLLNDTIPMRMVRNIGTGMVLGAALSPKNKLYESTGHGAITGAGMGLGANLSLYGLRGLNEYLGNTSEHPTPARLGAEFLASGLGAAGGIIGTEMLFGKKKVNKRTKAGNAVGNAYALKELGLERLLSHSQNLTPISAAIVSRTKKKVGTLPSVALGSILSKPKQHEDDDELHEIATNRINREKQGIHTEEPQAWYSDSSDRLKGLFHDEYNYMSRFKKKEKEKKADVLAPDVMTAGTINGNMNGNGSGADMGGNNFAMGGKGFSLNPSSTGENRKKFNLTNTTHPTGMSPELIKKIASIREISPFCSSFVECAIRRGVNEKDLNNLIIKSASTHESVKEEWEKVFVKMAPAPTIPRTPPKVKGRRGGKKPGTSVETAPVEPTPAPPVEPKSVEPAGPSPVESIPGNVEPNAPRPPVVPEPNTQNNTPPKAEPNPDLPKSRWGENLNHWGPTIATVGTLGVPSVMGSINQYQDQNQNKARHLSSLGPLAHPSYPKWMSSMAQGNQTNSVKYFNELSKEHPGWARRLGASVNANPVKPEEIYTKLKAIGPEALPVHIKSVTEGYNRDLANNYGAPDPEALMRAHEPGKPLPKVEGAKPKLPLTKQPADPLVKKEDPPAPTKVPGALNDLPGVFGGLTGNHQLATLGGGAALAAGLTHTLTSDKKKPNYWGPALMAGGGLAAAYGLTGGSPSKLLDGDFWSGKEVKANSNSINRISMNKYSAGPPIAPLPETLPDPTQIPSPGEIGSSKPTPNLNLGASKPFLPTPNKGWNAFHSLMSGGLKGLGEHLNSPPSTPTPAEGRMYGERDLKQSPMEGEGLEGNPGKGIQVGAGKGIAPTGLTSKPAPSSIPTSSVGEGRGGTYIPDPKIPAGKEGVPDVKGGLPLAADGRPGVAKQPQIPTRLNPNLPSGPTQSEDPVQNPEQPIPPTQPSEPILQEPPGTNKPFSNNPPQEPRPPVKVNPADALKKGREAAGGDPNTPEGQKNLDDHFKSLAVKEPSMFQNLWNWFSALPPMQKALIVGGLLAGGMGIGGMFAGGGESGQGGMGMWGPMLGLGGLAAAAYGSGMFGTQGLGDKAQNNPLFSMGDKPKVNIPSYRNYNNVGPTATATNYNKFVQEMGLNSLTGQPSERGAGIVDSLDQPGKNFMLGHLKQQHGDVEGANLFKQWENQGKALIGMNQHGEENKVIDNAVASSKLRTPQEKANFGAMIQHLPTMTPEGITMLGSQVLPALRTNNPTAFNMFLKSMQGVTKAVGSGDMEGASQQLTQTIQTLTGDKTRGVNLTPEQAAKITRGLYPVLGAMSDPNKLNELSRNTDNKRVSSTEGLRGNAAKAYGVPTYENIPPNIQMPKLREGLESPKPPAPPSFNVGETTAAFGSPKTLTPEQQTSLTNNHLWNFKSNTPGQVLFHNNIPNDQIKKLAETVTDHGIRTQLMDRLYRTVYSKPSNINPGEVILRHNSANLLHELMGQKDAAGQPYKFDSTNNSGNYLAAERNVNQWANSNLEPLLRSGRSDPSNLLGNNQINEFLKDNIHRPYLDKALSNIKPDSPDYFPAMVLREHLRGMSSYNPNLVTRNMGVGGHVSKDFQMALDKLKTGFDSSTKRPYGFKEYYSQFNQPNSNYDIQGRPVTPQGYEELQKVYKGGKNSDFLQQYLDGGRRSDYSPEHKEYLTKLLNSRLNNNLSVYAQQRRSPGFNPSDIYEKLNNDKDGSFMKILQQQQKWRQQHSLNVLGSQVSPDSPAFKDNATGYFGAHNIQPDMERLKNLGLWLGSNDRNTNNDREYYRSIGGVSPGVSSRYGKPVDMSDSGHKQNLYNWWQRHGKGETWKQLQNDPSIPASIKEQIHKYLDYNIEKK